MEARLLGSHVFEGSLCVGEITPYGLLSATHHLPGLMQLFMEQVTHHVTDAFSLLSYLLNPILQRFQLNIWIFKTKVVFRKHYISNKVQFR
jgi:hypothetical protein